MSAVSAYSIRQLLDNLNSLDADIRFMSFNDLNSILSKESTDTRTILTTDVLESISEAILPKLDDPITEVQNQAVKWYVFSYIEDAAFINVFVRSSLEPLMQRISTSQVEEVVCELRDRLKDKDNSESKSSITYMALRTVIGKSMATSAVARIFIEHLLPFLYQDMADSVDSMDVLTDMLKRFGSSVTSAEVGRTLDALLKVVLSGKNIIRKRAVVAVGFLSRYLDDKQWQSLNNSVLQGINNKESQSATIIVLIFLCGILAKSEPVRFKNFMAESFPKVASHLEIDTIEEEDSESNEIKVEVREAVLSALESLASLEASVVEPYLDDFINIIQVFVKYDPNYLGDDEDEEGDVDMEDDADSEIEFSDDDNTFSDDEDQSWKLRRHAARLGGILAATCPTRLPTIFNRLLDLFSKRLSSEREISVKIEIISSLSVFIKSAATDGPYYSAKSMKNKRKLSDASIMMADADPQTKLGDSLSALINICLKELSKSSTTSNSNTTHGILDDLLTSLVISLHGLGSKVGDVVSALNSFTKSKAILMVDVLKVTDAILKNHNLTELNKQLPQLIEIIVKGIEDPYYKISNDALDASQDLFQLFKSSKDSIEYMQMDDIENGIISKATGSGLDLETREKATIALGCMLTTLSLEDTIFSSYCDVLIELANIESLRKASISAIESVTFSKNASKLNFAWISKATEILCTFLKQSSRFLRLSSLKALKGIVEVAKSNHTISQQDQNTLFSSICSKVLSCGESSLSETLDAQLISVILNILNLVYANIAEQSSDSVTTFVASCIYGGIATTPTADVIIELVQTIATNDDSRVVQGLCNELVQHYFNVDSDTSDSLLAAQAVAICVVNDSSLRSLTSEYKDKIISRNNEVWSLMVLGNVGRLQVVNDSIGFIVETFSNSDKDSIKSVAAKTVGCIAGNNVGLYLNDLLTGLQDTEHSHLYLVALKELIITAKIQDMEIIELIWNGLFAIDLEKFSAEDSKVSLLAECVGRLSIVNPDKLLPILQSYLKSDKWSIRAVVLSAVKYSFGQTHDGYDDLLRPVIVDFLALVEDSNLAIRQIALNTLVSAMHNKPHLLASHLIRILPILYQETIVNKDLVRTVQMGPFKHRVDDGLDVRKTSYEAIYTLVTTFHYDVLKSVGKLDVMYERVVSGLTDEHDIKVLSCVIIGQLSYFDLDLILTSNGGLENLIGIFSGMAGVKVKENAIKQEFEKQSEVLKNVFRASEQIDSAISRANSQRDVSVLSDVELTNWSRFVKQIKDANSALK